MFRDPPNWSRRWRSRASGEVLPANEQPQTQAVGTDPLAAGRDAAKRVRTTAAAKARAALPRRSRFVHRKLARDPRFEAFSGFLSWGCRPTVVVWAVVESE